MARDPGVTGHGRPPGQWLVAPAKLTLSLRVLGRRADGYHELEAEMVSLDLHDRLYLDPSGEGVEVVAEAGSRAGGLPVGDNIVSRALAAVGRSARVVLHKRIPVGGGLGGGSSDAGAILRWAGVDDPVVAARLGADVPFCVGGGRAVVRGLGELVRPLPFQPRSFVLLVPPFSVDTAAAYRAWDELAAARPGGDDRGAGGAAADRGPNDLAAAALAVEPRLARWSERLEQVSGRTPVLAGSGSTWWVEGTPEHLGLGDRRTLDVGRDEGRLIPVRTVPAGWAGPPVAGSDAPGTC
jgi:4-diphosphocytidyl-2-C-methyl-D-erythritol kinase